MSYRAAAATDAGKLGYLSAVILLLQNDAVPSLWLNDTGITDGGNKVSGNTADCVSDIRFPQDCNDGRDALYNVDQDGHAGFSFTKLDSDGKDLPAQAVNWTCVKDNVTGLIWEVKTNDSGQLHSRGTLYKWGGKTHLGSGFGTYYDDWNVLVDGSNAQVFCGQSNWRVPTRDELLSLVNYGDSNPSIDHTYFPNTMPDETWSASPYARDTSATEYAWVVYFLNGASNLASREDLRYVRLVSGE